jgi:restriction system protein
VDWSNPEEWMPARLSGDDLATAQAIWKGSKGQVNPRHTTGVWLLSRNCDLLDEASDGTLSLSERGQASLGEPAGEVVRDVDDTEGLLALLRIVGENGPASSSELQEPWAEHLRRNSRIKSDSATRSYLYQRLRNLLDRELVARSGQQYAITPTGMAWMGEAGPTDGPEPDPNAELIALVREKQNQVKEGIREILLGMDPHAFEHLIHDLLVEMGFVDVEVTSPSNDKGVDVVGKIELGITSVREVIQVKRHRRTIQRKDLDALRGCLHRFQAVRGTIITTSRCSSGTEKAAFEPGAAPITLIDGEKLVELLAKHEVGVKKRKVEVWELDESVFEGGDEG